jgi:hypothetical protein
VGRAPRLSTDKEEELMETWEWIVLAAGLVVLAILALAFFRIRQRRARLKDRFGPEYDRAVTGSGTGTAERRLHDVEREREQLDIRVLPSVARERYLDEWRNAEARFVGDPREAVRSAERLVERLLEERGYPENDDAEHRLALVAVDHPEVVERYRHGRAMVESDGAQRTEDLRKAMLDYRTVLEDLLQGERTAA